MAGSTFQPPIHLDPSQDSSQQIAFTNQNFQSIASVLETNSFRIVNRGTTGISSNGSAVNWVTVPHNLGFAPVPFVFLNNVTRNSGSTVITTGANIPFPTWSSLNVDTSAGYVKFSTFIDCVADSTNLYIFMYNATGAAVSALQVGYYLIQQPATA